MYLHEFFNLFFGFHNKLDWWGSVVMAEVSSLVARS